MDKLQEFAEPDCLVEDVDRAVEWDQTSVPRISAALKRVA